MLSQVAQLSSETRDLARSVFLRIPVARPCAANVHIDLHTAERTIFFTRDGYQYLKPTDLPVEVMQTARVLLLDGYEPEAAPLLWKQYKTPCRSVLDVEQGDEDDLLRLIALATDVGFFPWRQLAC